MYVHKVEVAGRSEATAVNHLLVEAKNKGYDYVFKVDDDHVLPPTTLQDLIKWLHKAEEKSKTKCLVSGVTPWMHRVWEWASGPDDPVKRTQDVLEPMTDVYLRPPHDPAVLEQKFRHRIDIGHFDKYDVHGLVRTKLASAANFLMRPESQVLWSDIGQSSLFADAVWFLQLQAFLGYELYFDPGTWVWHVAAPSGGVREKEGDLDKVSHWDHQRRLQLDGLLEELKMGRQGWPAK